MEFVFTASLKSVVFWLVTLLWGVEFIVYRSRSYGERRGGRLSYALILMAVIVSLGITGALYHLRVGNLSGAGLKIMRSGALATYASGVALRYWAAQTLGSWFSRGVEANRDQALVTSGPYRHLRHPLYLGLFLSAVGLNALMGNPGGAFISTLILAAVLNVRMVEEERVLESTLGSRYSEWRSARYRFFPFVY